MHYKNGIRNWNRNYNIDPLKPEAFDPTCLQDMVTTALKSSIRSEFGKYHDKIDHLEEFAARNRFDKSPFFGQKVFGYFFIPKI
jgi:hypothetical protein